MGPTGSYPEGYYQHDYLFHPADATYIIRTIPPDSYHWGDVERKRLGKVEEYEGLLRAGKWQKQGMFNGLGQHPIRFDKDGEITHGVVRMLACAKSGMSIVAAVVYPPGKWEMFFEDEGAA